LFIFDLSEKNPRDKAGVLVGFKVNLGFDLLSRLCVECIYINDDSRSYANGTFNQFLHAGHAKYFINLSGSGRVNKGVTLLPPVTNPVRLKGLPS
jgi:hypothetical protein